METRSAAPAPKIEAGKLCNCFSGPVFNHSCSEKGTRLVNPCILFDGCILFDAPKDSKEFFEDPKEMFKDSSLPKFSPSPTSCQIPYEPGPSMSLHPMPSTTTDADADVSGSSSPRISSNFQHE
ncbi:unnamed protein product [Caenorhabditis nigoni]